ncbi:AraC family transcriptional regulator [Pseudonocardia sp. GCM10023141]|uniref:AraC family transcriptional regulator n=1 Tax=Pseudonocardia sp. GCM10023141 TaxID=3252653 RepID=UPI003607764A
MDAFGSLLDGPRARGAFLLRAMMDAPWSMRIQDEAPLTLMAVTRGEACITAADGVVRRLRRGDVAIILGPDPYVVADEPATPVQVLINPGQVCTTPDGQPLDQALDPAVRSWGTRSHGYVGVRTWGNTVDGTTSMLIGTYRMRSVVGQRLIAALPTLLVLPEYGWESSLLALLGEEITKDEPGQDVVLDRLLDLLLVAALRTWFARPDADAPGWYRAGGDPIVGRALRMLQDNPAHGWTVASLAAATGVSRAALARRFTELVGEPPMTFLASWRLAMAADLLRDSDSTLDTVARQVGYGSSFALSTAFKRFHGVSPQQHRTAAAAS